MRMIRLAAILSLCVLLLAGCVQTDEDLAKRPKVTGETSPEAPLRIGLLPEHQIFAQVERYQPLAGYLSRKIGRKVKFTILPRYGNIIESFLSAQMDGAFFGSFTYALAHHKVGVEVIARPEGFDGVSTYHGLIFVRKDSGITSARDLKGKTFAFVDRATTAGYLLPLAYFKEAGIKDYDRYLKETYFTGTHEDAIRDVLDKKADIGAAKNTVFDRLAKTDERIINELTILKRSPDVPENALALSKNLDGTLRSNLRDALLTMHSDPEGKKVLHELGVRRFIVTTDAEYEPLERWAQDMGLDLATYDYMKD